MRTSILRSGVLRLPCLVVLCANAFLCNKGFLMASPTAPNSISGQHIADTVEEPVDRVIVQEQPFLLTRWEYGLVKTSGWRASLEDNLVTTAIVALACQVTPFVMLLKQRKSEDAWDCLLYGTVTLAVFVLALILLRLSRWIWPSAQDKLFADINTHFCAQSKTAVHRRPVKHRKKKELGECQSTTK